MVLGNTPRKEIGFTIEASKSFAFGMLFKDSAGVPINLQDTVVRLVAAEPPHLGGTEVLTVQADIATPASGFAQFNFQADDLALDPASYPYDVTYVPTSGYSIPIIKGFFEIGANVDLDTSNIFSGVDAGSDISVIMEQGLVIQVIVERGEL